MAIIVEMTQLSPTMEEGVFVEWQKKEGDLISPGDALASVETDKAVMDLEAFDEGVLLTTLVKEGDKLPVGSPIAILGNSSEDIGELIAQCKTKLENLKNQTSEPVASDATGSSKETNRTKEEAVTNQENQRTKTPQPPLDQTALVAENTSAPVITDNVRIKASPLAKKIAAIKNISLSSIQGSGPGGRIVKRDVERAAEGSAGAGAGSMRVDNNKGLRAADQTVRISMMRKTIAARLTDSKSQVPHFYLHREINIQEAASLRKKMNTELASFRENKQGDILSFPEKISLNDFIIRANAMALKQHPDVNAQWNSESIIIRGNIDIGIAVAIDDGLITPIIRNADRKSLFDINLEVKYLAEKARQRKLGPEEYTDGSFTISNLGMFGIDFFEAIINAPEAALMAVGRSKKKPMFNEETKEFEATEILTVTLSCDHRVVDGAKGAIYLNTFASLLEQPRLLI